ncbi:MAG: APC family permease [Alicyclobacillus sp.]|nr:APC family permease [Alicyclobacillus sp.]
MADSGKFKKKLNLLDLTLLGLGSIIGSGWLFGARNGANIAGNLAWVAWVFGALAVIFIGLVYAELAAAMPRAGGFVRYPEYTHGSLTGWLIGFASMLAYSSVAGVETDAFREYAAGWWPAVGTSSNPTFVGILIQVGLLVIFFLINYWSVNVFGKINTVVTLFKFIVPIVIVIMLFTHMQPSNYSVGGASPGGLTGIMQAVTGAGIVFAYLGFRQAVDYGGEARNPQRDIPRAVILSVVLGAIMYLLLQFAFIGAVPKSALTHGWAGVTSVTFAQPYADIAKAVGLFWLSNLVFADAVISPTGTGNIYVSATARVLFAWAKRGMFYKVFGRVNSKTGIPRAALWLSLILSIVWILPFKFQLWSVLIGAVTSATVMTYMVGPISVMSLRKTDPDMPRPFRLKAVHAVALLAFIFATWIIYWSGWQTDVLLIGLTLGSLVLYLAFMDHQERYQKLKHDWKSGIWLIVYYIFILVMTRIGAFGPTDAKGVVHPIIPSPWDTVIVAIGAIILFYWGIASRLPKSEIDPEDDEEDKSLKAAQG